MISFNIQNFRRGIEFRKYKYAAFCTEDKFHLWEDIVLHREAYQFRKDMDAFLRTHEFDCSLLENAKRDLDLSPDHCRTKDIFHDPPRRGLTLK